MPKKTFYNDTYQVKFSLQVSEDGPVEFNGIGVCMLRAGETTIKIIVSPKETIGTLIHEIVHAVDFMFDGLGIEKTLPTDECYAYMVGWLANKMVPFFLKHKI